MEITSLPSVPVHSKPNHNAMLGNTKNLRPSIMDLDTNGDGQISDDEFVTYRMQKHAGGQFIPQDGPMPEKVQQSMFEALLQRDDQSFWESQQPRPNIDHMPLLL